MAEPKGVSDEEQAAVIAELKDDAVISESMSEADIEAKYDSNQNRMFMQRNDFLIPNILQMVEKKEIFDLSPSYQRRTRWSDKKRSHLIESLLMNVPIPPIYLYERDLAKYEVMDGQQRLESIRLFFNNEFKLVELKKWPELNGRTYCELPPRIQSGLTRRGLAAVIILTESGQDESTAVELRQYVFERLNTGGVSLNPQEVRNCIFSGHFNDLLITLARSDDFTATWAIPPKEKHEPQRVSRRLATNRLYATLADCEIVLRYFALSDLDKFKSGMKRTLDECMRERRRSSKAECEVLGREYLSVLAVARTLYGDKLFRLPSPRGAFTGRRSIPLADAVMLALARVRGSWSTLVHRKADLVEFTYRLLADEASYEIVVGRGNTKNSIAERIWIVEAMFRETANR